uniref:Uncharacterized protein n=1 Tax=Ciona savignyi TaxID=51511 RepID=H2YEM4_CIOSA
MEPSGIKFCFPDDGSISLVSYHYSINSPLSNVEAGQYNVDVSNSKNGYYTTENPNAIVKPNDKVNYWINVITTGGGYLLTDQTWYATDPATTVPPTAPPTAPPTEPPTTKPIVIGTTTPPKPTNEPPTTTEPVVTTTTVSSGGGSPGGGGSGGGGSCTYPCNSAYCDMTQPPCNGLIFEETWDTLDLDRWQHELTMSGGGNWEFQYYTNNRTNSYVRDNTLFIKPTLTADHYGEAFLSSGTLDLWGSTPADLCTANAFYGCSRSGSGSNYINPIQSARIRTVNSFAFKYGRIEIEAKMPKGDWIWPAMWLLPKLVFGLASLWRDRYL